MTLDARDLSRAEVSANPFIAAAALAWIVVAVGSTLDWLAYGCSVALLGATGVLLWLGHHASAGPGRAGEPFRLLAGWSARFGDVPASVAFLGAVAALRIAAGGIGSGAAVLATVPVFYVALSGSGRRQLYAVLVALVAFYVLPIAIIGPPPFPHTQYRAALLSLAVSTTIGIATQELVQRVRSVAGEGRRRELLLERLSDAVHRLFESANARQEVCTASRSISEAAVALLFEPDGTGGLVSTAIAGLDVAPIRIAPAPSHPLHMAIRTHEASIVTGDIDAHRLGRGLWLACGGPETVLYQPLVKGEDAVGVLVVAWAAPLSLADAHATVLGLLAHEAAVAITRADQIRSLAEMAQTDPLTGLPNRRSWDARLAQAASDGQGFTIAILDLDNFKQFNDTHGHPAGDRLLRETTAAWRDQVRTGDLLARLGGEEFGVLLFDCDLESAVDVTERLRSLVWGGQTCSVGLAVRAPGESIESVVGRADRALYGAKHAGRDRACAAA